MKNKTRLHQIITRYPELRGDYTQGEIQRNIEKYGVTVDGVLTHDRLLWIIPGQHIDLSLWPKREITDLSGIKIVQETEKFLVIFKPAGVVTQPGAGHPDNTLYNWVLDNIDGQVELQEQAGKYDNARISAGLVHRLDKDTAGLILVAKTLAEHTRLQDLFRERKVEKHYLAVLQGHLTSTREIQGYQARDQRNPKIQKYFERYKDAVLYDQAARANHSIFTPMAYNEQSNQTLVDVEIKTGRMHQIRLQASNMALPILNDMLYGDGGITQSSFASELTYLEPNNMQLLSNSLSFEGFSIQLIDPKKLPVI